MASYCPGTVESRLIFRADQSLALTKGVKIRSTPRGQYSVSIDIIERVVPGEVADGKPVMHGCCEAVLANMDADASDMNLGQSVDGTTRRPVIDNVRFPTDQMGTQRFPNPRFRPSAGCG